MHPNISAEKLRILIVDNCDETLELYPVLFACVGYAVRNAATKAEALAIIPEFRPNVVFTSIVDLDHTGANFCIALRKLPETADALIIAVSCYGVSKSDKKVVAGFDYFLVKPVGLKMILQTMQHLQGYRGDTVPLIRIPYSSGKSPASPRLG